MCTDIISIFTVLNYYAKKCESQWVSMDLTIHADDMITVMTQEVPTSYLCSNSRSRQILMNNAYVCSWI